MTELEKRVRVRLRMALLGLLNVASTYQQALHAGRNDDPCLDAAIIDAKSALMATLEPNPKQRKPKLRNSKNKRR